MNNIVFNEEFDYENVDYDDDNYVGFGHAKNLMAKMNLAKKLMNIKLFMIRDLNMDTEPTLALLKKLLVDIIENIDRASDLLSNYEYDE